MRGRLPSAFWLTSSIEREGDEPAVAPSVRIINVSIGNRSQPFDREVSPLARLLDWLSWKYKLFGAHEKLTTSAHEKLTTEEKANR